MEGGIYISPEFQLGQVYDGTTDDEEEIILYRPVYVGVKPPKPPSHNISAAPTFKMPPRKPKTQDKEICANDKSGEEDKSSPDAGVRFNVESEAPQKSILKHTVSSPTPACSSDYKPSSSPKLPINKEHELVALNGSAAITVHEVESVEASEIMKMSSV